MRTQDESNRVEENRGREQQQREQATTSSGGMTAGDDGKRAAQAHKPDRTNYRSPQAQVTSRSSVDSPMSEVSLTETADEQSFPSLTPAETFKREWSKLDRVVLKLGDGQEVVESRSHLSMVSDFFRVLFSHTFSDSNSEFVGLHHLPPRDVLLCIAYSKCSEATEITLQRAINLLETASFLQLKTVIDWLSTVIIDRIAPEEILSVYRLALSHGLPLAAELWSIIIRHFHILVRLSLHLEMTEMELIRALRDSRLGLDTKDERTVADGYAYTHPEAHSFHNFLADHSTKRIRDRQTADDVTYPVFQQRIPRMLLLSVGGWSVTGVTSNVECYNPRSEIWTSCQLPSFTQPEYYSSRAYQGIVCSSKSIIMAGGFSGTDFYQDTYLFNFESKMWSRGCNLHIRRNYAVMSMLRSSVGEEFAIICGGRGPRTNRQHSHIRLDTCEVYDVQMNHWMNAPKMNLMRSDGGACSLFGDKQVLAVGGFDGQNVHDTTELYDAISNKWYPLGNRMRTMRTGNSCVEVVPGVVMTSGGFDKNARIREAEMLDVREGKWHPLPDMRFARSNYGMATHEGVVYVAGGFDGDAICAHLEQFDFRAYKWQTLQPLLEPKSALRLLAISNVEPSLIRDFCGLDLDC